MDSDDEIANSSGYAFKINHIYKEKMEHQRKIEETQRLRDRYGKELKFTAHSDSEYDSSSGSEDDHLAKFDNTKKHHDFLNVLSKIRNQDAAIYSQSEKFYRSSDSDSGSENESDTRGIIQ